MPRKKTDPLLVTRLRNKLDSLKDFLLQTPLGRLTLLLFALSAYLRLEPIFFNLTHFSFDQGIDIILVKKLVIDHDISLIARYTGLEGIFMGPYYTWIMSIPYLFSGGNPSGDVFFMTIIGLSSSLATFYIFQKLTNQSTAFFVTFFTLFGPNFIGSSQIVLSPSSLVFLGIVYFYLITQIIIQKNHTLLPLLVLLLSFFFQFEIGYAVFAAPAAILTIFLFSRFKPFTIKNILLSSILFVIPFTPQILFDFRHDQIMSNAILGFFQGTNTSLGTHEAGILARIPLRFFTLWEDASYTAAFSHHTVIGITIAAAIALGWYLAYLRSNQKLLQLGLIAASLIILTYSGFIVFSGPVWGWYRAGTPILFAIISGIGLSSLYQTKLARPAVLVILFYLLYIAVKPTHRLAVWSGHTNPGVAAVTNQHAALDSIYQNAAGQPFALYVYTPPVYPYIWDYQLYWYAQNKYGYLPFPYDVMPQANNPELVYLLVEPDEYPTRIDGWLGNFKGHGQSLETWSISGDITIHKWQFDSEPDSATPLVRFVNIFD